VAKRVDYAGTVSTPITLLNETDRSDFSDLATLANGNFVAVIVGYGKYPIVADSSGIGMHRDIAGAVVVEIADSVYLEIRTDLRHDCAATCGKTSSPGAISARGLPP
jgi:hypothetical protein